MKRKNTAISLSCKFCLPYKGCIFF